MGRLKKNQTVQSFSHLTEALRRGRRRIKPEYVPELVSWLLVHSFRYERQLEKLKVPEHGTVDPYVVETFKYVRNSIAVIQHLINTLNEGFDKYDWLEATGRVGDELGIEIGKPIPENMDVENMKLVNNEGI
jgi:hypothetical protein